MRHYGMRGFGAFGAVDFDSASVWAGWKAQDPAAAKKIQARLNELGFANPPLVVDGDFGSKSMAAYCAMLLKNGQPKNLDGQNCWPGPKGLSFMDATSPGGGATQTGGNAVAMCQSKTGEYVPCGAAAAGSGTQKAGLGFGGMLAIGIGVVAVVGVLALVAKKKKAGEPTRALSNRSRRRRRARKNFNKAEWQAAKKAIKAMKKTRKVRRRR